MRFRAFHLLIGNRMALLGSASRNVLELAP